MTTNVCIPTIGQTSPQYPDVHFIKIAPECTDQFDVLQKQIFTSENALVLLITDSYV